MHMTIDEVLGSVTVFVTKGSDPYVVAAGLDLVINPALNFYYQKPVEQGLLPYSTRIFSVRELLGSFALPRPSSPGWIASQLFQYTQGEARYDPPENPGKQKGWEIRQAMVGTERVAVAIAVWI
jgi:hypothetical protein